MDTSTKILFTDLDGTLLNDKKEVTPGNHQAIDAALQAGHKIVVTTGRAFTSAVLITKRAGLFRDGCYIIAFNGGLIYEISTGKIIYERTLPAGVSKDIFRAAQKAGLHIQTYSDTKVLSVKETPELIRYTTTVEMEYQIVPDLDEIFEQESCKVICINYQDKPRLERFQKEVLDPLKGTVDSFFSNDALLEIVPSGTSKGTAVEWFCEHMGIPIENSVAAGDAQNDIEMLKAAHIGAVMKNAFPGVAEFGNYITENDNNHDGFAEIVNKWIL